MPSNKTAAMSYARNTFNLSNGRCYNTRRCCLAQHLAADWPRRRSFSAATGYLSVK